MLSPVGVFIPLVPNDIIILSKPEYNFIEKIKLFIGRIFFSSMIRINKILKVKTHGAETLWKCMGWAMKVPKGIWDIAIAYQQGMPTYIVAEKITAKKKFAWINADIFASGYNIKFNSNFYREFDSIVPVSDILKERMLEKMPEFKDKYEVVYDVLNPNIIHDLSLEQVTSLRTKMDEYILVTTARLVPEKGYDIAVTAASFLKQNGVKFHWYFIGEGIQRAYIEKMKKELEVDDEVVLLGLQTNPYAYMAQADIYVQTSKFEGFGMTIGEAKILGKPIVSTNFDVVYNQLSHEKNGLIAEMNGESVAKNILRLINDSELKNSLVKTVKQEINNTCTSEVINVEKMIDKTNNSNQQ